MLHNVAILVLSARTVLGQEAARFDTTSEPEFCTFTVGRKRWDLSPLQINRSNGGRVFVFVFAADYTEYCNV